MPNTPVTEQQLLAENEALRLRLGEAEAILREMRSGEVDALVVSNVGDAQLFTLKDSDQSFRLLVEKMSEGALTMTAQGVIVYANRSLAGLLKTPLEKVIGSTLRTWIAPDSQPILQSVLSKGAGEERRAELMLAAGDGTRVPVYLSVSNLPLEGSPDAYCLVAIDLTEHNRMEAIAASERVARELLAAANQSRQELLRVIEDKTRAEAALAQESERSRMLLRSASDAIILADGDGNIIEWNVAAERLFGYTHAEACGQPLTLVIPERYRGDHLIGMQRVRAGGARRIIGRPTEFQALRRTGAEFPVELSLSTWESESGTMFAGIIRDITERKQAALLLVESESQRLAEMSAALEVQNQSSRAALSLMADAIAARQQAESLSVALNEQLDELRRWQQVTLNRESRILAVKKEINDLLAAHGQPPRYPSVLDEGAQE